MASCTHGGTFWTSASAPARALVPRPGNRPSLQWRIGRPVRFREEQKGAQLQQQVEQQQAEKQPSQSQQSVERKVEKQVTHTTKQVASQVQGILSDPVSQAQSYWYLGTAALVTAVACLAVPGPVASLMLNGTPDAVVETLVRAAGATLVTSATVKYTLKEASVRGQLHMHTFRRLNLGLVLQTGATLVVAAQAVSLRNPLLTGYMALVCLPGLLLASRLYSLYKQGGGLPLPSPKKTLAAVVGVLLPRNLPAAAYSLLTLVFAGMSAMCLSATPGEVMKLYPGIHGPMSVFAERCAGAGLMLMTLVAYSLKDGADRGKLGATSFRWLNLGVAGSLLSMVWYFSHDFETGLLVHTAKGAAMVAVTIAAFAHTGYMYIAGTSTPKTNTNPVV